MIDGWYKKLEITMEQLRLKPPPPPPPNIWNAVQAMVDTITEHVTKKPTNKEEMLQFVSESFLVPLTRNSYASIGGYF